MINIGTFDKRVTIFEPIAFKNEIGYIEKKFRASKVVWARIEPLRGREYYEAKQITTADQFKITIRYRSGIDNSMMIGYGKEVYEIQNIIDPYMKHNVLECMCVLKEHGAGVEVYGE